MTFFKYLDTRFRINTVILSQEHTPQRDGDLKACLWLTQKQHTFCKWMAIPKLIVFFWLTKLGLKAKQTSPLPLDTKLRKTSGGELAGAKPNAEVLPN